MERITLIDRADLGPVIARADHRDNAIEVNRKVFYDLPPMVQEFVLCHEVCHLKYDEWDEGRTNQLAADLFMRRATGETDSRQRADFLAYLDGTDKSNISVAAILAAASAALGLAGTVVGIVKQRNAGWYSWTDEVKRSNLNAMLRQAFEESRKTASQSAAQLFWAQMCNYTNKDDDLDGFLSRTGNEFVGSAIATYERRYGFGFREVTPIDITAFPLAMAAIGALVGFAVYKIVKNRKK